MSVDSLFANASVKTVLAPMAGYTDFAFRSICSEFGAGLTVSEMISSVAVVMNNELTRKMLFKLPSEKPSFCQIFGHNPEIMAESVKCGEIAAFDGIDINMGCPVKKIVRNGDGSALMENPKLAAKCITAVKLAIGDKPLSVKFRLGVDDSSQAVNFTKTCRDAGADFVTVHFRTRKQMYSGTADYTLLPNIAECGLPVFANGDIISRKQYDALINDGAYGVSIGRGAVGRPYIFAELSKKPYEMDLLDTVKKHIDMLLQVYCDRVVANEIKKHVAVYLKGKRNAKSVIVSVNAAKSTAEIVKLTSDFISDNAEYRRIANDKYSIG